MAVSISSNVKHRSERIDMACGRITGFTAGATSQSIAVPLNAREIIAVELVQVGGTGASFTPNQARSAALTATLSHSGALGDVDYVVWYERGTGAALTVTQASSSNTTTTTTTTTTTSA